MNTIAQQHHTDASNDRNDAHYPAAQEYLAFRLGEEEYGIDILAVQEIRCYENVTRIAGAPAFIKGMLNLRGTIVPIVDMRLLLDVGSATYDKFTVVIVLNITSRTIGVVVDSVSDVLMLPPAQIRPTPDMSNQVDTRYLLGLGTIDDRMLILVDIEKLMSGADLGLIEQISGNQ